MDRFYAILLKQQTEKYARTDLTQEDYEDIYYELTTMELPEAQPWILAMTYLGLGTGADPEGVLARLAQAPKGDVQLQGLYCDLQLLKDEGSEVLLAQLRQLEEQGFTAAYLKERSHAKNGFRPEWRPQPEKEPESEPEPEEEPEEEPPKELTPPEIREMAVIGDTREDSTTGPFITGEISYMRAGIRIDPLPEDRTLHITNRILDEDGKPFSKVFEEDIKLKAGREILFTTGWGNKSFNGYPAGKYCWEIDIDGIKGSTKFEFHDPQNDTAKLMAADPYLTVNGECIFGHDGTAFPLDGNTGFGFGLTYTKELRKSYPSAKHRLIHDVALGWGERYVSVHAVVRHVDADKTLLNKTLWIDANEGRQVGSGSDVVYITVIGDFEDENGLEKGLYEYSVSLGNGPALKGTFTVV